MESIKDNTKTASTPDDWTKEKAKKIAKSEGLILTDDHLAILHALQEYYSRHDLKKINVRELHDALNEKFHQYGGIKYVYSLFPGGPVAQGCRLAGLQAPAGAIDKGFGSVV
jgi:tRNA 2-thiouridine synthesizing protein E